MFEFRKKINIKCNIDDIFRFHLNPENINVISPPGLNAKIVSITDKPLKSGSVVKLEVSQLGIKSIWVIEIVEYSYPRVICDQQRSGFFNYWKHYHIFEVAGDEVEMTDKVILKPPLGLLGYMAYPAIWLGLSFMFRYRHYKTKKVLEK
ncbi:MAG: hypothetical protein SCALA702_13230 [Melioribacteraceae bacterium]|nr:MAG: hypothetical protein SCALA702_13230 [Melioribacteraceae bacterium]